MRVRILLLLILCTFLAHSQDQVSITMKNGKELTGYGKVTDAGVKYKAQKKGKYKTIKPLMIDRVIVTSGKKKFKTVTPYVYRILKKKGRSKLVNMFYSGDKVELFTQQKTYPASKAGGIERIVIKWYVKRKGESTATLFSNNRDGITISTSFKKQVKRYFSDCEELVNKIGKKGFRKGNLYEIVDYYAKNCGS